MARTLNPEPQALNPVCRYGNRVRVHPTETDKDGPAAIDFELCIEVFARAEGLGFRARVVE